MHENEETKSALKSTGMVALITAVCLLGDSMLYVVLPIYWQAFGLESLWQVGVLLAVNRLVRLPFNPLAVRAYGSLGRRRGVLLSIGLAALATAGYSFLQGFWPLFAARCLWGASWTFLRLGAYFSILEFAAPQERGQHMGVYNGIFRLGSLFGMLGGAIIADRMGPLASGYIFALGCFFAVPLAFYNIPVTTAQVQVGGRPDYWRLLTKDALVGSLLVTGFSTAMVYQGLFVSMLSYLTIKLNVNIAFMAAHGLGAASVSGVLQAARWSWEPWLAPALGRLSDGKRGRCWLLKKICFAAALLLLVISFNMPVWLWILTVLTLQMTGTGVTTLVDAAAADIALAKKDAPAIMSAHAFAIDLGSALGPLAGYALNYLLGIHSPFIMAAVVLAGVSWLWQKLGDQADILAKQGN